MTRKLPWLQADSVQDSSSPRSSTSSRPRRQVPILDSSDVEEAPVREKRKRGGPPAAAREVSDIPPNEPPEESFMIDGFNNDDRYRMVEDEFLDVAKEFTQHLHTAEYLRMKNNARAQNAATINSISRPVTTKMGGQTRRKVESVARAKKQADAIKDIHGDQPREELEGDSDESQGPWLGTALHGLMERPRASAMPLTDISGFSSTSKAAAGYKGSSVGRMETYDVPDPEEFELAKPTTIKPTEEAEETQSEDDDDDLGAAPVVNHRGSDIKKELIEKSNIISKSGESRQSELIKNETFEASSYNQGEQSPAERTMSAETIARIARRREQARIKRMKEEEDAKNANPRGAISPHSLVTGPFKMASMDLDAPISIAPAARAPQTAATILCCNCGAPIDGQASANALCYDCVKLTMDVSGGIQREATLHFCRDCERWLLPPTSYIVAAPESRELLALCLKKLRGLHKVRIIDASFIWTEPHSRRIKVKLTIQDSVSEGVVLQQSFEIEYVVAYQQCPDCAKSYTANTWRACVQVRQKVPHKRTFLYLEQLILKHGAHKDSINIKEVKDGLDFYFAARNQATAFVDFLTSVAPVKSKKSQELISMDIHTSTKSYKFSYSVELVPICKDDLVALPIKLAQQIGNMNPIALCYRVGTAINLLDPSTLQTHDVSTPIYWRAPFTCLADVKELVEFVVLDIDLVGVEKGRWALAEATVARASDLGVNDKTFFARTHLGNVIHPGDSVMGYVLSESNFNNPQYDAIENSSTYASYIPDVMLVKKFYARKKKPKNRNWRLKRMNKEEADVLPKKGDQEKMDKDYEMFLRDVEEDTELRQTLAVYKAQQAQKEADAMSIAETSDGEEDNTPQIDMDELLDEFDELQVNDANAA
ncbi:hypothetical protein O988_06817 [Pseudogymnoascus sp. VKM F-3808]|nr:hypothetical protein O988_06817 [Pseudogymnoascus sp. VKM F-3808]